MSWPERPPLLFLAGFMGAGKSSVGRALAARLDWSFVDLDRLIEKQQGKSIADLFCARGEPAFRRMETAALRRLLQPQPPAHSIIALGGGAYTSARNRQLVANSGGPVVWLHAPVGVLLRRCRRQRGRAERPLLRDEMLFRRLYRQRLRDYARAGHKIETGNLAIDEVASRIEQWLAPERPSPKEET